MVVAVAVGGAGGEGAGSGVAAGTPLFVAPYWELARSRLWNS